MKNHKTNRQKILEEAGARKQKALKVILKIVPPLKNRKHLQKRQFAKNDFKMRINIHCNSKDR